MPPPTFTATAPGRVNLIGEHTDYNLGFVLPTVIPQTCNVTCTLRPDRTISVYTHNLKESIEYQLGQEMTHQKDQPRHWWHYIQGITWALQQQRCNLKGCDLTITSDVPLGSGLSSSAALDVALLRVFSQAFNFKLEDLALARLAQKVENDFVGAPVGILDPLACHLAQPGIALFVDTQNLQIERVPIPDEVELIIIHSGLAHQHAGGDYATRVAECQSACQHLNIPNLRALSPLSPTRDLSPLSPPGRGAGGEGMIDKGEGMNKKSIEITLQKINSLPPHLAARARHVLTENQRVLDAVDALKNRDLPRLGQLFNDSHASQRDDYAVSIPEVDTLVEIAQQHPAIHGARLTGGGFGGSIVALAQKGQAQSAAHDISQKYQQQTGHQPRILVP